MKYTKFFTIWGISLMWLLYFIFEVITGRVNETSTYLFNIMLILLFAFTGYIFYRLSSKYKLGISSKALLLLFVFLMLIDQVIKLVIKLFFFNTKINILNNELTFDPLINTHGSWLNARFGTSINYPILILINILGLIILLELYRYFLSKNKKIFWGDLAFIFLFTGALCSLIDKIFYGGSLDFIGISNLFVADIKDIYINLGLYLFLIGLYDIGYLTSNEESNFKDDLKSIKTFTLFIRDDFKNLFNKK